MSYLLMYLYGDRKLSEGHFRMWGRVEKNRRVMSEGYFRMWGQGRGKYFLGGRWSSGEPGCRKMRTDLRAARLPGGSDVRADFFFFS